MKPQAGERPRRRRRSASGCTTGRCWCRCKFCRRPPAACSRDRGAQLLAWRSACRSCASKMYSLARSSTTYSRSSSITGELLPAMTSNCCHSSLPVRSPDFVPSSATTAPIVLPNMFSSLWLDVDAAVGRHQRRDVDAGPAKRKVPDGFAGPRLHRPHFAVAGAEDQLPAGRRSACTVGVL